MLVLNNKRDKKLQLFAVRWDFNTIQMDVAKIQKIDQQKLELPSSEAIKEVKKRRKNAA